MSVIVSFFRSYIEGGSYIEGERTRGPAAGPAEAGPRYPVYIYPAKYLVGRAHLYPATGVAGYKSGLPSKIHAEIRRNVYFLSLLIRCNQRLGVRI